MVRTLKSNSNSYPIATVNSLTVDPQIVIPYGNGNNPIVSEIQNICNALQYIHNMNSAGVLSDTELQVFRQILISQTPTEEVLLKREAKRKEMLEEISKIVGNPK